MLHDERAWDAESELESARADLAAAAQAEALLERQAAEVARVRADALRRAADAQALGASGGARRSSPYGAPSDVPRACPSSASPAFGASPRDLLVTPAPNRLSAASVLTASPPLFGGAPSPASSELVRRHAALSALEASPASRLSAADALRRSAATPPPPSPPTPFGSAALGGGRSGQRPASAAAFADRTALGLERTRVEALAQHLEAMGEAGAYPKRPGDKRRAEAGGGARVDRVRAELARIAAAGSSVGRLFGGAGAPSVALSSRTASAAETSGSSSTSSGAADDERRDLASRRATRRSTEAELDGYIRDVARQRHQVLGRGR